jgi:type I restriction enzyme M protein
VLFIDARRMGEMATRVHRELTDEEIELIALTYHSWRCKPDEGGHEDSPGFSRSVSVKEIAEHDFILTPGRYVGAPGNDVDEGPFERRLEALKTQLDEQLAESHRLATQVRQALERLTYS